MKARLFMLCGLSLILVFASQAQSTANWTILHYGDVDNNLEGPAFNDYYEMQNVGSGDGVEIVAQIDRAEGHDNRFGDWTDTRRFHIEHVAPLPTASIEEQRAALIDFFMAQGNDRTLIEQQSANTDDASIELLYERFDLAQTFEQTAIEELGEVDMGESQALLDFIVWGAQTYPAEHYMLVIGSHGAGWRGLGPDEGAGESILTLPEIDAALTEARAQLGIEKFDIVGFDACLMGVTDVALMLEPHAGYVLFAQEVIPFDGWEYTHSIAAMQANPDWDAFQVGANFIDNFMEYYAGVGARRKVGLSMVETAGLPNLVAALEDFAATVDAEPVELLSALGAARNNSQTFGTSLGDRAEYYSYIDLRDFMNWFSLQSTITEDAYNAAQAVIAAYDATVVYSLADDALPNATGLAIYLPSTPFSYETFGGEYPSAAPASMAFWQDYLNGFYRTISSELDGSALQLAVNSVFTMSGTASIVDTPVVSFDAAGKGVVDMNYIIYYNNEDGSKIVVDSSPIAYYSVLPSGETALEYPNELTPSTFTWLVQAPILSDGTNSVLGLLQANGGNEAVIQGTYLSVQGNYPAFLVYDITTLEYRGMLAISGDAPSEVRPLPGEQFVADLFSLTAEGELTTTPQDGAPLTFGNAPFSLTYQAALNGEYTIALSVKDLAGNAVYANTSVTVNNDGLDGTLMGYSDINEGVYFQYPYIWGESYVISNDDGSITMAVGDLDALNTIFVDSYPEMDAASAVNEILALYEVDIELSTGTVNGIEATWASFDYETDTGLLAVTVLSVLNEDTGSAIVLTVQGPEQEALLTMLNTSLTMFAPPE